jgi:hypothetical protein
MKWLAIAVTGAALAVASVTAQAQKPASKPAAKPTVTKGIPRTSDGKPDFTGNWENATITPFERLGNQPLVLTEEAAANIERSTERALEARERPSDPNRGAPPVGGELRKSPNPEPTFIERVWQGGAGPVGGYNSFWIDPGERVVRIDGVPRSSILIDPPDGRVPALTAEARQRMTAAAEVRKKQGSEFDHPELRPLGERCIMSFGNNAGPPMLPNYFYNNNYTFVQTKDNVVFLAEMVHDARIARFNGQHVPKAIRPWMGDSIARWEGDTLVVETTNFHPLHGFRGASENLKVTERLTLTDANTINYKFTVEDPTTFTAPFTGELPFRRMPAGEQIYEYACHEGNYGLEGVMSGARAQEREAAKKKSQN